MVPITDKEVAYYATFITGHPEAMPDAQHLAAARAVLEGLAKDDRLAPVQGGSQTRRNTVNREGLIALINNSEDGRAAVDVTVDLARELLDAYVQDRRPLKQATVDRYAQALAYAAEHPGSEAGTIGEGIHINRAGGTYAGQHLLHAVVHSGEPARGTTVQIGDGPGLTFAAAGPAVSDADRTARLEDEISRRRQQRRLVEAMTVLPAEVAPDLGLLREMLAAVAADGRMNLPWWIDSHEGGDEDGLDGTVEVDGIVASYERTEIDHEGRPVGTGPAVEDLGSLHPQLASALAVAAVNALPWLLSELERLQAAVALVGRLNRPMVDGFRRAAADTSPNWDVTATVYPPSARGLVALIDGLLAVVPPHSRR